MVVFASGVSYLSEAVCWRRHLLGQPLHRLALGVVDEHARRPKLPAQAFTHREHEAIFGDEERMTLAGGQIYELLPLLRGWCVEGSVL